MGIVDSLKKVVYCIDDDAWKSGLKLEGFYQSNNLKFLNVLIYKCLNSTEPGISKSKIFI
jgi:hypothetical protein